RARQFQPSWLPRRDLILAMDARNLADLRRMARGEDADRIRLFSAVGGLAGAGDIPDPWGGGPDEFGHVLDLLGAAAPVIAARLARLLQPADDADARSADGAGGGPAGGAGGGPADGAGRRAAPGPPSPRPRAGA